MIEFINRLTGTRMWVADERKEQYLEAGHKLASSACAKKPEVAEVKAEAKVDNAPVEKPKAAPKPKTKKPATKKATSNKK